MSDTGTGPPGALARPDWRTGGEFTAADLNLDQSYRQQRIRRHLRLVHGWGVVCGLTVVSAGDGWNLYICPGYGIGPCGDEIYVVNRYRFDLRDYLWTRPLRGKFGNRVWIAIEAAAEEQPGTVPSSGCGCGCGCSSGEQTTAEGAADGFRVVVSWTPPHPWRDTFDVCGGGTPRCPPCPDTCGLTLAVVTLPDALSNRSLNISHEV